MSGKVLESTSFRMVCAPAGKLMCRYLLRRCDNSPAPWDAGVIGDGPWLGELPKEATEEMKNGQDVHKPSGQPFWDYDAKHRAWQWVRNAPVSVPKNATMRKPTSKREEASVRLYICICFLYLGEECGTCFLTLLSLVQGCCGLRRLQTCSIDSANHVRMQPRAS